uniref:Uncharacterized protein n=1 Tax=Salix viminalis TaxID=40686 RepID=A0A6N2KGA5_SALVM
MRLNSLFPGTLFHALNSHLCPSSTPCQITKYCIALFQCSIHWFYPEFALECPFRNSVFLCSHSGHAYYT